ncbi:hypothetical protein COLO4_33875 [Corchorus olitorius]|uniref:Uncharacterized protein n=1 Tax=Corchorus olitorius TaxID=93759 RepID=A0A1R3GQB0_9ROSI|nr:hypothetical protein COLO4_33875 [Corchorus olitorius]
MAQSLLEFQGFENFHEACQKRVQEHDEKVEESDAEVEGDKNQPRQVSDTKVEGDENQPRRE